MQLQLGCSRHESRGWAGRETCSRKLGTACGLWRFVTELREGGVEGRAVCGWPHCLLLAASHCERQRHALAAGHQEFNGAAPWLLGAVDGVTAAGSSVVPSPQGHGAKHVSGKELLRNTWLFPLCPNRPLPGTAGGTHQSPLPAHIPTAQKGFPPFISPCFMH